MIRYDRIGRTYIATRRPEPRIAAQVVTALGPGRSVLNVGAGTGSYEPTDRFVVAVEPSAVMVAQRAEGSAPAVRAVAEQLPVRSASFDVVMATLTIHHWTDWRAGVRELARVARERVVVMAWDQRLADRFWMNTDYFPETLVHDPLAGPPIDELAGALAADLGGTAAIEAVPVRADCSDGFYAAYWARPEAYLDPAVRAGISCFALVDQAVVDERMARLAGDLRSGRWDERHGHLRTEPIFDFGYRLVVARADR